MVSSNGRKKVKELLWGPFYKGTNPVHEGSILMTQTPPKDPTS